MPASNPFANLPAISFANADVSALTAAFINGWQAAWSADTGETVVLSPADRRYHFLLSFMGFFIAAFEQLDASLKQDLLPFATGGFLDNDVVIFGKRAARLQPVGAACQLQFTLPAVQNSVADIPVGTQVGDSGGSGLIWTTNVDLQIQPGNTVGYVNATCTTTGTSGNNFPVGTISALLGWTNIVFTPTVTNTNVTIGGAAVESDDAMRVRDFGVTDSYSNAGSYGAYQFFAESADPSISQITVLGPGDPGSWATPGQVIVTVLCQNGAMPNSSVLANVANAVTPNNIRDLCAQVFVQAPTGVPFSVNVSYWVPVAQANNLTVIQNNVAAAVQGFITNCKTSLGPDVDPSALTTEIYEAGGIRVVVNQPAFINCSGIQIPVLVGDPVITYLGLT
jgi:phage-related baseplate assembly protein